MSQAFFQLEKEVHPIGCWNVDEVTNMYGMFREALAFNQPLDSWNVGQVGNMYWMFREALAFNQPLDSWNVGLVTTMASMFRSATVFNQCLGSWAEKTPTDVLTFWMLKDSKCTNTPNMNTKVDGPWCQDLSNGCVVPVLEGVPSV